MSPNQSDIQETLINRLAHSVHSVNSWVRPFDYCAFGSRSHCLNGPIFMVGPPRSGSTLTYQVFVQSLGVAFMPRLLDYSYGLSHFFAHSLVNTIRNPKPVFESDHGKTPGILSPSEAFGFWRDWFAFGTKDPHVLRESLSPEQSCALRDHVSALQARLDLPFLFKCLYLSLSVDVLAKIFPNSRFLMIRRNPIANCASIIRARMRNQDLRWWSIRPPGFEGHLNEPLADQVVWQLSEIIRISIDSLGELSSNRWRYIDFEDLCNDPTQTVNELIEWLEPVGVMARPTRVEIKPFVLPRVPSMELQKNIKASKYFDRLWANGTS